MASEKVNGMRKFETKEELVEWIETMHLQNTNGRETGEEMFRLGIEAAIEELPEFNLLSIPNVSVCTDENDCECERKHGGTKSDCIMSKKV